MVKSLTLASVRGAMRGGIILGVAILLIWISSLITEGVWSDITHEAGFALLISLIVWSLFEIHRASISEEEWRNRIERVTNDVFFAVLRKNLPKNILDAAHNIALNANFIRTNFEVNYDIADHIYSDTDGGEHKCVLLHAMVSYKLENISTAPQKWKPTIFLPNPIHADLKKLVEVKEWVIKKSQMPIGSLDLAAAKESFQKALSDSDVTAVPFGTGEVTLEPGEAVQFRAKYVMAKEEEDSELLQTGYPAASLSVSIADSNGDSQRVIRARSVHPNDLDIQVNGYTRVFRISECLLPHQGILVWWKKSKI